MAETYTAEQVRELLEDLKERDRVIDELLAARVVAFHPVFAEIANDLRAGVLLSQAYFISNTPTARKRDGWFWRTAEQWTAETYLSYSEQKSARARLVAKHLLEEKFRGTPAKLWSRVRKDEVKAALLGKGYALSPQKIIEMYRSDFAKLSAMNYAQAKKTGREAEMVDYAAAFVRDMGICYRCKRQITDGPGQRDDQLQFDHVIAGGPHTAANLRPTHAGCNRAKNPPPPARKSLTSSARKSLTSLPNSGLTGLPEGLLPAKVLETTPETTTDISIPPEPLQLTSPTPEDLPGPVDPDAEKLTALKTAIDFMENGELDWTPADIQAARKVVASLSKWKPDSFRVAVFARYRSDHRGIRPGPPADWLPALQTYKAGPLNRFLKRRLSDQELARFTEEALATLDGRTPPAEQQMTLPRAEPLEDLRHQVQELKNRKPSQAAPAPEPMQARVIRQYQETGKITGECAQWCREQDVVSFNVDGRQVLVDPILEQEPTG